MNELSLTLALLSSGIWLGSIVFLSAVLAPIVFKTLSATGASHLLRVLFPRYYVTGIICAVILHLTLFANILSSEFVSTAMFWSIIGSLLIFALAAYSLLLIPRINRARDAGSAMADTFDRLHKRSVLLNVFSLFITLAVFINLAIALQSVAS